MNQEFYQDMARRTHAIALYGEIFSLMAHKGQTLTSYGFERLEDQIMLVFMVLRIIMEKSLADEVCTLDDIALSMMEMNADLFHLPPDYALDEERAKKLALIMVEQILTNNGEPLYFDAFHHESYQHYINYLTSRVFMEGSTTRVTYGMSDDGFRLLLSTLEMEENMQLRFRDMVFQLQLKKRNFSRALDEIRHIFDLLKIKEREFQEKVLLVRKDAMQLTGSQYKELIDENFELMSESRQRFLDYEKQVNAQIEEINHGLTDSALESSSFENLQTLRQIDGLLSQSVLAIAAILKALQDFSSVFSQELSAQFRSSSLRRYSFTRTIFDPLLKDGDLLCDMDRLLHPLFIQNPDPQFSLMHTMEYKQILSRQEEDGYVEVDDDFDLREEEKRKIKAQKEKEDLQNSVFMLMKKLLESESHTLTLVDFGQPEGFLKGIDHTRMLLSSWMSLQNVSISQLKSDQEDLVLDDELPFSFPLSLMEFAAVSPALLVWDQLKIEKAPGQISYQLEEDGLHLQVQADNICFRLEKGKSHHGQ